MEQEKSEKIKKIFSGEASEFLNVSTHGIKCLVDKGILIPAGNSEFRLYGRTIKANYFTQEELDSCLEKPEFKDYQQKHHKRQESSYKAVKTKTDKTLEIIKNIDIKVIKMDVNQVNANSLKSKENWYFYTEQEFMDVYSAPKNVKVRWRDNYIRHELTSYDENLCLIFNKTGKQEAYELLENKITKEIRKVYPFYKKESYEPEIVYETNS